MVKQRWNIRPSSASSFLGLVSVTSLLRSVSLSVGLVSVSRMLSESDGDGGSKYRITCLPDFIMSLHSC